MLSCMLIEALKEARCKRLTTLPSRSVELPQLSCLIVWRACSAKTSRSGHERQVWGAVGSPDASKQRRGGGGGGLLAQRERGGGGGRSATLRLAAGQQAASQVGFAQPTGALGCLLCGPGILCIGLMRQAIL